VHLCARKKKKRKRGGMPERDEGEKGIIPPKQGKKEPVLKSNIL